MLFSVSPLLFVTPGVSASKEYRRDLTCDFDVVAMTSRNAGSVRTRTVGSALYNMSVQMSNIISSQVSILPLSLPLTIFIAFAPPFSVLIRFPLAHHVNLPYYLLLIEFFPFSSHATTPFPT